MPKSSFIRWLGRGLFFGWIVLGTNIALAAPPVTLSFQVAADGQNPIEREIWADVVTPSGETVRLPAYYDGGDRYAVRARAETAGQYRLASAFELEGMHQPPCPIAAGTHVAAAQIASTLPQVGSETTKPDLLVTGPGKRFVPLGVNLAWPPGGDIDFYKQAFTQFRREGLNWVRIWMAHWSHLNLDWRPEESRQSPPPGTLDVTVAESWDKIISWAEDNGLYLQIVLQHHGQYSSKVDPNWAENPWNAALPGGFLATPADFFSSEQAARVTRAKYRYIVARWGYSPAVMAWELFNEVHWVDALRLAGNDAEVARWHSEMAAFIRSVDRYGHLVTTSTEDTTSAIYTDLDYVQPHLYSPNILVAARRFSPRAGNGLRPAFRGEIGDDHIPITPEQKATGIAIVPPVWASLMGEARLPAQPWQGAQLMATGRLHELGAVSRFLAATNLMERPGLEPFSPAVESAKTIPLAVPGGQRWQKAPPRVFDIPMDGSEPIVFADIPRILVGSRESIAEGYASRVTYRVVLPKPSTMRIQIVATEDRPAAVRVLIDGRQRVEQPLPAGLKRTPPFLPATEDIRVPLTEGAHTIQVENSGGDGWLDLAGISFDVEVPVLAAAGQRGGDFIAVWIWDRQTVLSAEVNQVARGTVLLEEVPAGNWQVVWWDTLTGKPHAASSLHHGGGRLRIPTPDIRRHAAVVLQRTGR